MPTTPAPTFDLATVKRLAADTAARRITDTARGTAWSELGLAPMDVYKAVAALKAGDFYKTMESETEPGTMQDVYRPTVKSASYPKGIAVYCKVRLLGDDTLVVVVVSFKKL